MALKKGEGFPLAHFYLIETFVKYDSLSMAPNMEKGTDLILFLEGGRY